MNARNQAVVVATDGSTAGSDAVRYAVAQAARMGVGVDIVHVFPSYVPVAPMLPPIPDDLQEVGRSILAQAVRVAAEADPSVDVTFHLRSGRRCTRSSPRPATCGCWSSATSRRRPGSGSSPAR